VYVELTGGRQRALWTAAPSRGRAIVAPAHLAWSAATPVRRTPRPIVPTETELAAHARLVARLTDPLWTAE
jgi:DNA polymerase-3 subunit epsilon